MVLCIQIFNRVVGRLIMNQMSLVLLIGGWPRACFVGPLSILEPRLKRHVGDLPILSHRETCVDLSLRLLKRVCLRHGVFLLRLGFGELVGLVLGKEPHLSLAHLHVGDSLV